MCSRLQLAERVEPDSPVAELLRLRQRLAHQLPAESMPAERAVEQDPAQRGRVVPFIGERDAARVPPAGLDDPDSLARARKAALDRSSHGRRNVVHEAGVHAVVPRVDLRVVSDDGTEIAGPQLAPDPG
jgi:hypothetical protein